MGETTNIPEGFTFYGMSDPIPDRKKYFKFHIPKPLAVLLGLTDKDKLSVFVNTEKRELLLRVEAPKSKVK